MAEEIIIGNASTNEGKQIYLNGRKEIVRKVLERYPLLHRIFGDFRFLDGNNQTLNAFFNILSSERHENLLVNFESILSEVNSLSKQRRSQIMARLCEVGENNFKLLEEFLFYSELLKNNKVSEIHYEDIALGNHDFRVTLDETKIDIDVTSLGKTPFQIKTEEGFRMACEEIIKDLPPPRILQLDVILDRIPIKKETTAEEIKNYIMDNYQIIKKIILVDMNGICRIENLGNSNKFLIEDKETFSFYSDFGSRLLKLDTIGENFLKTTREKDIFNSCFDSFIIGPARYNLVEIHSECNSWSKAESLRKNSLIEQIKRNIRQKLSGDQLTGKINPIIAFSFSDFSFMDYWSDQDQIESRTQKELIEILHSTFRQEPNSDILGILVYERNLKNSLFVQNPCKFIEPSLLNKIKLLSS